MSLGSSGQAAEVDYLKELFPSLDEDILRDVLHQSNRKLQDAVYVLLGMTSSVAPQTMDDEVRPCLGSLIVP